jgi:Fur family ferric uptake transcriptional regulator
MSKLEELSKALQAGGYRLTRARQAIFQALVDSGGHVSADDIAEVVRREAPNVGRMTVYRTLDLLRQLGLVQPVYQGTGAAHYILMDEGHHHHLVCSQCDRVVEFEECIAQEMSNLLGERFDFQIQGHLLEFYGLCPACQSTQNGGDAVSQRPT